MPREDALMAAGRKRLRPILMTTFALVAGMVPVAVGIGEGGEFYRPMAVAIIGGVITSTFLTLLVIPSFYDSIEISRDRMIAKFKRRAERYHASLAFVQTFVFTLLSCVYIGEVEANVAHHHHAHEHAHHDGAGHGGAGQVAAHHS
jgi:predicted RND superfamily exporter protein